MSVRIMFVDDERGVLESIERSLFGMMDEWDMVFASSGDEALSAMETQQVDVVVSDMRMPGMSGADLLEHVKERYPKTIRFVLTGQLDEDTALRTVNSAHQYLSKPCDPAQLQDLIERALRLRALMDEKKLSELIGSLRNLPVLPRAYEELVEELGEPEPSIRKVSEIVQRDVAMCAKILHITNSAFFGLRCEVTDLAQAVSYLGLNTLKSLVLAHHAFSSDSASKLPEGISLEALSNHGIAVGACCRAIAGSRDRGVCPQEAFTAGILHDVGKIVLAANLPEEYERILESTEESRCALFETEREVLGTTHAEVGAYLLGIWGLPDLVVEAVAYHHSVSECDSRQALLPLILGLANASAKVGGDELPLNPALRLTSFPIDRVSAADLEGWNAICTEMLGARANA